MSPVKSPPPRLHRLLRGDKQPRLSDDALPSGSVWSLLDLLFRTGLHTRLLQSYQLSFLWQCWGVGGAECVTPKILPKWSQGPGSIRSLPERLSGPVVDGKVAVGRVWTTEVSKGPPAEGHLILAPVEVLFWAITLRVPLSGAGGLDRPRSVKRVGVGAVVYVRVCA